MCDQRIEANDPILSHDELIEKLKRWEHFMDDFMTDEELNEVLEEIRADGRSNDLPLLGGDR